MAHTTLGIDIKTRSVSFALCSFPNNGQSAEIRNLGAIPYDRGDELSLKNALEQISRQIDSVKGVQIDNIGLGLDPTSALYAHRTLPFNDPKTVEKILPQDLNEIWKIDGSSQIAFKIGDKVSMSDGSGEEAEDGYDILALNYPMDNLASILGHFKNSRIDPHLAIPITDAMPYAVGSLIKPPEEVWALLDIGENHSILIIGMGDKISFTRTIKVGGVNIDEAIAAAFEIPIDDARKVKEQTGFIALAQQEQMLYTKLLNARRIVQWNDLGLNIPCNPVLLSQACNHGLEVLITALRQSVVSFSSKYHVEPECFYLSGGCARLNNIDGWLSQISGVPCYLGMPLRKELQAYEMWSDELAIDISAAALAAAASANADNNCPLNLRKGALAHKGSLAFLQDNKWLLAAVVVALIIAVIFSTTTRAKTVKTEHDLVKQALEQTTSDLFGRKMLKKQEISKEIADSEGYDFLPVRTAFTHFAWISSNVNDNLADIEMDLSSLDIDTQRKIVTIKGEVAGDDGLPRFMQLLEQYECFPKEIQEPKTTKVKEKTSFTLRVEANHCAMGGESE